MNGYKLTTEQKEQLQNREYKPNCYFNPVQDVNGDWFIFDGEVNECEVQELQWVKDLPIAEYIKPTEEPE